MALDWSSILRTLNSGVNFANSLVTSPAVQTLTGAGLIGAGLAQKEEPGYATEAVQYLRNRLAPTGIADQFSGQIGALNEEYRPYLEQQRNQLLDQTQQRYIAGQPSSFSTAMSGPEIQRIRDATVNQILPGERAHIADIGRYLLTTGGTAAGTLLDYAKPDPLGEYLATLGVNMLGGRGGQPGQGTTGGGSQLGQQLLSMFGGNTSVGDAISQAVGLAQTAGDTSKLAALLSSGVLKGVPFPIGLQASTPAGQVIQQAINAGLVESPAAIPTGAASGGGLAQFLGSSLGTVLGLAGIAAGGYGIGNLASNVGQNQFQSSAGGALGGAAAGAAAGTLIFPGVGTAIGAVVGGLSGLFGGLFGERSEQHAEKAYNLSQDRDSQADQFNEIKALGVEFAQQFGLNPSAFLATASQLEPQLSGPGDEQALLATALGQMLRAGLGDAMFAQVAPQLKQRYLDYMLRSTFTAPNSSYSGGAPQDLISKWGGFIGLAKGGYITRPTNALVGERGVELAHLEPGSYVVPFQHSRN